MGLIRDTSYMALDLELNGADIIQVGVAIGNADTDPDDYVVRSWYVQPKSGEAIHPWITDLTGIDQDLLDSCAVDHGTVASELGGLIHDTGVFVNPVQWGLGDADELLAEFRQLGCHFPHFGRRVIDVKHFYLYIEAANGHSLAGGLRSSMGRHGLQFSGTPHRADHDALNTLRFFFHLLRRQESLELAKTQLSQWRR
jgi:inhibitor of KinA sporulation pathway (predicted exonuclease)